MTALLLIFLGLLGLVIGSFLNVVIWRVPRGESVVSPPSACPRCEIQISPRDNIPVLSWLLLRGRCRHCGQPISVQYPLVEAGTALLFVSTGLAIGLDWSLPAWLYLAAIAVALTGIDIAHHRLPNSIVLPSYPVVAALFLLPAITDGAWDSYLRAILGGLALFAFYFLLAIVYPAGMGGGDVKLAGILGAYLGWLGWGPLVVGAFGGFLVGAVFGLALIVLSKAGRKTKVPFGPFMFIGTYLGLFFGQLIADWYVGVLGL